MLDERTQRLCMLECIVYQAISHMHCHTLDWCLCGHMHRHRLIYFAWAIPRTEQYGNLHRWTATHGSMCRGRIPQVCMGYTSTTCDIYLEHGILINTIANIQLIHIECVDNTHLYTHQQHIKCIKANTRQLCIRQAYTYNTQTKTMSNTPNMHIIFLFDPHEPKTYIILLRNQFCSCLTSLALASLQTVP